MLKKYSYNKKYLVVCFMVLAGIVKISGQNHDYIWLYGWANEVGQPDYEGGRIDFSVNPPLSLPQWRPNNMGLYGHAMADSTGEEILYYSNGLHIFNREDEIMEGGEVINPGYAWVLSSPSPYVSPFSGLSISFPDKENEFLKFHQRYDTLIAPPLCCIFPRDIYYSHIDMTANEGLGSVLSKNNIISSDFNGGFGLTKTADNEGWWLVFGVLQSNIYHTYRIDSAGVNFHQIDTLGINVYEDTVLIHQPGYSLFSPDGTKFAHSDYWNGIHLLDFDRCEGQLSNAQFYNTDFVNTFTGLAFSPNSRFLYYNTSGQLIQLDTWADPGPHALDTIANWDRYFELDMIPFSDGFAFSQLAPDGKIYISATGSSRHMHVIERPNLPGAACGFRQHGFSLPTSNGGTIPHFPNYRLAPIDCE